MEAPWWASRSWIPRSAGRRGPLLLWAGRSSTSRAWWVPTASPQTGFTDRRNPKLAPGISYVNVSGVSADTAASKYTTVSVTFRVRAPKEPGNYPLAAAFWYGTEKGSPHGAVETVRGIVPLGGFTANSGRVRFSPVVTVQVK